MLTTDMIIVIAVLALYIVLMLSGKFSFPLCGITGIAILVLSGAVTLQDGFSGFTDKTVIMLAGMFPIAGQLGETSITEKIKERLLSAKGIER